MTLISQFLIFYLLTYFSGRGIYCLIDRNNNFQDKVINYSKNIFYPTISLVFLGNLSIIHYKGESTLKNNKYYRSFYGAMGIYYRKFIANNKSITPRIFSLQDLAKTPLE